jgi:hypothetical protein
MTRNAWTLTLATVAIAALAAPLAVAGGGNVVEIETTVKLRESFPAFHGKVKSDNEACVYPRRVKLFKQRRNGGRKLLGTDQTDMNGRWEVIVDPLKSGAYLAVAKRREEGTAGTIYVCARDRSKIAVVD